MIATLVTNLKQFGATAYEAFAWPGGFLQSLAVEYAPGIAEWLGIDTGEAPVLMTFLLSLASWFLVLVLITGAYRFIRNLVRTTSAILRAILFRTAHYLAGIRVRVVVHLRRLLPGRRHEEAGFGPSVEFDDLDMAVLRSASAVGPGYALSAPDLASRFKLLPSQVQKSMQKLQHNKMLDHVLGSTDGFENYRLTESGSTYLAMWQRQSADGHA